MVEAGIEYGGNIEVKEPSEEAFERLSSFIQGNLKENLRRNFPVHSPENAERLAEAESQLALNLFKMSELDKDGIYADKVSEMLYGDEGLASALSKNQFEKQELESKFDASVSMLTFYDLIRQSDERSFGMIPFEDMVTTPRVDTHYKIDLQADFNQVKVSKRGHSRTIKHFFQLKSSWHDSYAKIQRISSSTTKSDLIRMGVTEEEIGKMADYAFDTQDRTNRNLKQGEIPMQSFIHAVKIPNWRNSNAVRNVYGKVATEYIEGRNMASLFESQAKKAGIIDRERQLDQKYSVA